MARGVAGVLHVPSADPIGTDQLGLRCDDHTERLALLKPFQQRKEVSQHPGVVALSLFAQVVLQGFHCSEQNSWVFDKHWHQPFVVKVGNNCRSIGRPIR